MANLQYIGARYVPKFYLNPDDSSNEWKSGVLYEALTIVTYNNDSYTSKVTVPASVGNPADNPQYWACTTKYTAALVALQTTVGQLSDDVDNLKASNAFVTPELYGAVGDGLTDDTVAVQAAIDSKIICVCNRDYLVSSPLHMDSNTNIVINGTIKYTGADSAFIIEGNNITIDGSGSVTSEGRYAVKTTENGLGYAHIKNVRFNCGTANAEAVFYIKSFEVAGGISHCDISDLNIWGGPSATPVGYGILIETVTDGYVNENKFDTLNFIGCTNAIRIINNSSNTINRNKFDRIEAENATIALYARSDSGSNIQFNEFDFRAREFTGDEIQIDSHFLFNTIFGNDLRPSYFKSIDAGSKALYDGNIIANNVIVGTICSNSGVPLCVNGAFRVNGDIVVFDMCNRHEPSGIIGTSDVDANNVLKLDYTKNWQKYYPLHYFVLSSNLTDIIFDLNYISDWTSSPLEYIYVSGTTNVTIKNDATTLMPTKALTTGLYKLTYRYNKNAILISQEQLQ